MDLPAVAIINPNSAGGRNSKSVGRLEQLLPEGTTVLRTNAPGHAIELTRDALRGGAQTVIAVGGDGTINEVVNGFFDGSSPISLSAVLGVVPNGTGSDFRRSLNLPSDWKEALFVITNGLPRPIDVMRIHFTGHDGSRGCRYALNLASF